MSGDTTRMLAKAILTPRVNSHPFQERSVNLDQPLKIGRSVARSRPGASNAIFDCKVLSRNHALMWYEAGKFYLQDTKSSNGTFVNNVRLSKSSEESPPTQITSGDVLQFGVDVMELTKKVTHGCIVATLQLFTPDGKEAKGPGMSEKPPTTLQDVYALNQFIREAAEREEKLESKINEMSAILMQTNEALETGWKALIEEDRLLTRVDILERQLQACHKSMSEDKLREEVIELLGDKEKYQEAAKEALRKSLAEKLEAVKRHQELERTLRNGEDEREFLLETSEKAKEELDKLAVKTELVEKNFVDVMQEMESMSLKYKEELEALTLKLEQEHDLSREKDDMIKVLANVQQNSPSFSPPFKNVVSSHNHNDDEDLGAENEKDSFSLDETTVEKEDTNEINEELTELRKKLKLMESDKSHICARLQHIQEMFLMVHIMANNNPYTDVNLKGVVNKVDTELRQIKNGVQDVKFSPPIYKSSEEQDYGTIIQSEPSNTTLITPHVCNENLKLDDDKRVNQNESLEKLLEDARQTIVVLEQRIVSQEADYDHKVNLILALRRENEELVAAYDKRSETIRMLQQQKDELEEARDKATFQRELLVQNAEEEGQEPKEAKSPKLEISDRHMKPEQSGSTADEEALHSLQKQLKTQTRIARETQERADKLVEERAQLQQLIEENENKINELENKIDLSSIGPDGAAKALALLDGRYLDDLNDNKASRERILIQKQLLNTEEELAVYKDRYLTCVSENSYMKQELLELQSRQANQHKRLLFLIPFVMVLLLAILIVFNPLT